MLRVIIPAADVDGALPGHERPVVIADQRHADPVRARLVLQVLHVVAARVGAVVQLVLDLVGDDRAAPVHQLVPGDDAVHLRQPLVGVAQILRVVGAVAKGLRRQPEREAPAVELRIDVGSGPRNDVDAGIPRRVEDPIHVADAGEVVSAGRGRVIAPREVDRRRVESRRLHLLKYVRPQCRARQPVGVEFAGPEICPLAADDEAVAVERHRLPARRLLRLYLRGCSELHASGEKRRGHAGADFHRPMAFHGASRFFPRLLLSDFLVVNKMVAGSRGYA